MRYKQDWDMAKKRLTAFWDRDILDRCCISVKVPGQAAQAMPQTDAERLRHWTDPEYIIRRNRAAMEHTYYGGRARRLLQGGEALFRRFRVVLSVADGHRRAGVR